ncbi:hypothetical protein AT6N2_C1347 [Agrobacterium tumefaciens]|nr:hypothetical protein AT6N2_C1347 [Agrobacterium tumefaciens]
MIAKDPFTPQTRRGWRPDQVRHEGKRKRFENRTRHACRSGFILITGGCECDSTSSRKSLPANHFSASDTAGHKKTAPALFLPVAV